jgi:hypothetical protein
MNTVTQIAAQPPKSVSDLLDRAAEILTAPGAWTQGELARDANGAPVLGPCYPEAVCFCLIGAVEAAGASDLVEAATIEFLYDQLGLVASWNDEPGRTQQEVVDRLRGAAALARKRGK